MSPRGSERLGEKLKQVRLHLRLTQDQMAQKLGLEGKSRRSRVAEWETGKRTLGYDKLLLYAQLSGVSVEELIDDSMNLSLNDDSKDTGA